MEQICEDCTVTDQLQADQRRLAMLSLSIRQARNAFGTLLNRRISIHKFHEIAEGQIVKMGEILSDSNYFSNEEFLAKYKGFTECTPPPTR